MPNSWESWAAAATVVGAVGGTISGAILAVHKHWSTGAARKTAVVVYLREAGVYLRAVRAWLLAFFDAPYYGGKFHFRGGLPRESVPPPPASVPPADFADDVIRAKLAGARGSVDSAKGLIDHALKDFESAEGCSGTFYGSPLRAGEYETRFEEIVRRFSDAAVGCCGRYSWFVRVTDGDVRKAIQPRREPTAAPRPRSSAPSPRAESGEP